MELLSNSISFSLSSRLCVLASSFLSFVFRSLLFLPGLLTSASEATQTSNLARLSEILLQWTFEPIKFTVAGLIENNTSKLLISNLFLEYGTWNWNVNISQGNEISMNNEVSIFGTLLSDLCFLSIDRSEASSIHQLRENLCSTVEEDVQCCGWCLALRGIPDFMQILSLAIAKSWSSP